MDVGSLGLIPKAKPLRQALLDRWIQAFCFLGSAIARYCAGIGADLKAWLSESEGWL